MKRNSDINRSDFLRIALAGPLGLAVGGCGGWGGGRGSFYILPRDPETLTMYDTVDPPTLDPARSWGVVDGRIIGMIFSNLVRFTHAAKIEPDLAERWSVSEDGLIYEFHLHPEAQFSNGRPVVAEDVKYSFERITNPETAAANPWVLDRIVEINILDDHTVRLILERPFAPMLYLLAMPAASIVPREEVERAQRDGFTFGERPVGSGPWRFVEWRRFQHILLDRAEDYWGRTPRMKRYRYRVISSHFTAIAEFETGNLAAIDQLPDAEIHRWLAHPQWQDYTRQSQVLATDMVMFNCQRPPLDRAEVRRALCQFIEPELLIKAIRNGAGTVSVGPIPPGVSGHDSERVPFPYDPEGAKATLMESDLAGREIVLVIPSEQAFMRAVAEVLQALWGQAGVNLRVRQLEWVTYRQALRDGDFDVGYRGWFADYPDGDNYLFPLFHSSQIPTGNTAHYADQELDEMIERSQTEMDAARREQLLRKANARIYEQAPALFLWHRLYFSVVHPRLHEYRYPLIFNGTRYLDERFDLSEPESESNMAEAAWARI